MIHSILLDVINHHDVETMTTKEAKALVAKFYERVACLTFACHDQKKIDFLCAKALEKEGLEFLQLEKLQALKHTASTWQSAGNGLIHRLMCDIYLQSTPPSRGCE